MLAVAGVGTAVLAACAGGEAAPVHRRGADGHGPGDRCARYASPTGADRRSGTRRHPFRTVPRLARSLRTGQTGCLLPGIYEHPEVARLERPGSGLRGIGRVRVRDPIWITAEATGARLTGVVLTSRDPSFPEPLKVQADRARISGNLIFASMNTSCVIVGSERMARGVILERNRITHCGRTGKFDHLIYVVRARGTIIRRNVLSHNHGGWAVHMYPDADGTVVEHNIIDDNLGGVVFAGAEGTTSDSNVVRNNALTYSGARWSVEGSWSDAALGSGNLATANCLFSQGLGAPTGIGPLEGFAAILNSTLSGSPYRRRSSGDYRFRRGNACLGLVGNVARGLRPPAR